MEWSEWLYINGTKPKHRQCDLGFGRSLHGSSDRQYGLDLLGSGDGECGGDADLYFTDDYIDFEQ
jgi:hypothetical protein